MLRTIWRNEKFSEDKIVNVQGRRLLDFCKMSSLRILNGRMGVDYHIGRITCVTYNGQSLVDYVLSSPSLMQSISSFDVLSQTLYSDHNPIVFSVQSSFTKLIQEEPQSVSKMCWRPDHKDNFITSLDSPEGTEKLDKVLSLLKGKHVDENNVVEKSVTSFTCALRMVSDQYFYGKVNHKRTEGNNNKPTWADNEWLETKKDFFRSRDKYKRYQSDANRNKMTEARKKYKALVNQRLFNYEREQTRKLLEARVNNIRLYWRMLSNSSSHKNVYMIGNNEFKDYFMKLSDPGDEFFSSDASIKEELERFLTDDIESAFEELNMPITSDELKKSISQLKQGKSSGSDLLLNEFFIYGREKLTPYLLCLFNYIFDKGIFPEG